MKKFTIERGQERLASTPPPVNAESEQDYDELNDDTFGDGAMNDLSQTFVFSSPISVARPWGRGESTKTLGNLPTSKGPLAFDSAVTIVKARPSRREDLEDEEAPPGLPSTSPPAGFEGIIPPLSTSSSSSKPLPLTLAEIEAKLSRSTLLAEEARRWFNPRSDRPVVITFPSPDDFDREEESGKIPHRHTMTRYEREGIARIHLAQLTTENPELEDYYYRAFSKRQSKQRQPHAGQNVPLYLPLPTPRNRREEGRGASGEGKKDASMSAREREREKERALAKTAINEALANALGKVSRSSSRKPRQQLQIPSTKNILKEGDHEGVQVSLVASIEKIYDVILAVEDLTGQDGSLAEHEQQLLHEKREKAVKVIRSELFLDTPNDVLSTDEGLLSRFLSFMSVPKAEKVLGRALRAADNPALAESLLQRVVEFFEYLPACRHDAPPAEGDLLINTVLGALVPFVAKTDERNVSENLALLSGKSSLPWIVSNKAGIVLCCILLSRLEILKNSAEASSPIDAMVVLTFFDAIHDRLAECFTELSAAEGEFYGWQFMALLAMNVDADRKRCMVMELRERILAVVERNDPKAIGNLNIFLNVLGLDASQLSV